MFARRSLTPVRPRAVHLYIESLRTEVRGARLFAVWAVPIGWEVLLRLPSGRVADGVLPGGRRSIADAADSVLPESRVNTQSNSQDTAGCR